MDIGLIFNQCVALYMTLWNASFKIYGMSFTWGEIITYGLFIVVVTAFIKFLRE